MGQVPIEYARPTIWHRPNGAMIIARSSAKINPLTHRHVCDGLQGVAALVAAKNRYDSMIIQVWVKEHAYSYDFGDLQIY